MQCSVIFKSKLFVHDFSMNWLQNHGIICTLIKVICVCPDFLNPEVWENILSMC